jgi:DNA replication protein DnaC
MESLKSLLGQRLNTDLFSNLPKYGTLEYEQMRVDGLNNEKGELNLEDGYDCPLCFNKGVMYGVTERSGEYGFSARDCQCMPVRNSIMRMRRSGLEKVIKDLTFDKYEDTEPWQKHLKDLAMNYAQNPVGWFFLGGQPGCGKTHLCTAICRKLLHRGKPVVYMRWREEVSKLKALSMEGDERQKEIDRYKHTPVLYIDDLFKTGRGPDGKDPRPTSADVSLAMEILGHRYGDPDLLTIISTELSIGEITDIDEALGSRIVEKARENCIASIKKDRKKNYRLRGVTEL